MLIKQINNNNENAFAAVDNGVEFDISNFQNFFSGLILSLGQIIIMMGSKEREKKMVKKTQEFQNTWPTSNNRKKNNLMRDL